MHVERQQEFRDTTPVVTGEHMMKQRKQGRRIDMFGFRKKKKQQNWHVAIPGGGGDLFG